MLKVCLHIYFQGYHFRCTLRLRVPKYFKNKYDVRRHLQDQHSGVGFQCSLCGYLFNRRNMRHSCNVGEEDMEYVERATGVYGEAAREMLMTFIREKQDTGSMWHLRMSQKVPIQWLSLWLSNSTTRGGDRGPGRRETNQCH